MTDKILKEILNELRRLRKELKNKRRCKDCAHWNDEMSCPMCYDEAYDVDDSTEYVTHNQADENGYCDRWEAENDANDDLPADD